MLIPEQTVWENMILGLNNIPQVLPKSEIKRQILELSGKYCLQIDPMSFVWQLSIGSNKGSYFTDALSEGKTTYS